jgi:hypothetical protein
MTAQQMNMGRDSILISNQGLRYLANLTPVGIREALGRVHRHLIGLQLQLPSLPSRKTNFPRVSWSMVESFDLIALRCPPQTELQGYHCLNLQLPLRV